MKEYPLVKLIIGFISGIILSLFLQGEFWLLISLLILLIILSVSLKVLIKNSISNYYNIPLYISYIILGLLIAELHSDEYKSELANFYKEKDSKLYAEVVSIELARDYEIEFKVKIDSIIINNSIFNQEELLICKLRTDSLHRKAFYDEINPGNKVYLTGIFQKGREDRNPGEFNYHNYLSTKNIAGIFTIYASDSVNITGKSKNHFRSSLFAVRKSIDSIIKDLHKPETAGLIKGLVLADRSEINYETKTEFINSGVIHVLAVSGLHVGYILIIVVFIFGRFGVYTRASLTIIALLFFMLLTGASPSVTRATIMSIVIIIAFLTNRSTNIINSIALAAIIILIIDPNELFNPGFQLSFSAVLSIGIIYPIIQRSVYKFRIKHKWIEYIVLFAAVSLSAQIGTLPFTLAYFSKLSIIALLTNLIVIPSIGVILAIGIITIITGYFSYFIAGIFASANDLLTYLLTSIISFAGKLEISFLWIRDYSLYDSIIYYCFLIIFIMTLYYSKKVWIKLIVFILAFTSILIYSTFDDKNLFEKNKLNILMIDVGQGDSFLIQFPNGKTALVDAGEANPFIDNGERVIIPLLDYLGIDKIDYGFISHLDLDHYGGFVSLMHHDRIKEVYRPLPDSSLKSLRLEKYFEKKKIKTNYYERKIIEVGNTNIYVLNDPHSFQYKNFSSNDKSGVLKIVYGDNSFLFVGDCEFPAEYYLATNFSRILDSDVLKVGHHGSATGSSEAFLNIVTPEYALISAGLKNKFNHPSERVLNSLAKNNSKILRTDHSGAILLQSDGKEIKEINWKNN